MRKTKDIKQSGVSLRALFICIILLAVVMSVMMVLSTFHLSKTFLSLSDATNEYIELEKAAYELMDASDYLTERVQRFTADGNLRYIEDYFTEANENKNREKAIEKMSAQPESAEALRQLQEAMQYSLELMQQEYYAMRLVIEAKGYDDYPDVLRTVELTAEDAALSPGEKMNRASEKVLSDDYYQVKDLIRSNMKESLVELEKLTLSAEDASSKSMSTELIIFRTIIVAQMIGVFAAILLTTRLGIRPVLKAVEKIKDNETIPEVGANEFRYLARTYNKMYNVYKMSVERLNYKASHDELTGLYNRAGYDLLLSTVDLSSSYFIIIDIDEFKHINDQFGHEMGDKALIKVAETLRSNFRTDDYLCRIGGDEFVIFMVHVHNRHERLIRSKVDQINRELANSTDGIVPLSVSAGVSHGSCAPDATALFNQADKALYVTKHRGKNGCTFYIP